MAAAPFVPANTNECWASVEGARMRYLRCGAGHPLILLHGLLAYSFSWRFTLPAVRKVATAYAVDLLGTGYSDAPAGLDRSLRATADRVLKFADALGLESFDLLGTSHGGAVAQMVGALSVERSDPRLKRLILVAPVNPYSAHGRWLAPLVGSSVGSFVFRRTIARWRSLDPIWLGRLFSDKNRIPSDSLAGYRAPVLERCQFEHAIGIVSTWTADLHELGTAIRKISHYPTLLMWGEQDPAVLFESAERLRRGFQNCKLVTFPGVGHLPYEEVPGEFNDALTGYLEETRHFITQ
jgi:pimeloyl-ACP methyl ester carboxylesterase